MLDDGRFVLTDSSNINVGISSSFSDRGFRQAEDAIRSLQAASKNASGASGASAAATSATEKAAASAAKAEKQLLAQAQAQARVQATSGNLAAAEKTLADALSKVDQNSTAALRAQNQLAQIQNKIAAEATRAAAAQEKAAAAAQKLANASQSSGIQALPRTLSGLSGQAALAAKSVQQLATGMAGLEGLRQLDNLSRAGASADLIRQRFDQLAESAGTTGDAILVALRKASGNEINDLSLQLSANRAAMLGVADSVAELSVLMSVARDRAQSLGVSTEQAFSDLIVGLGRASPEILDNLAIQVSAEEVNQRYAASIGKTVEQLTQVERRQALVNAVIAQGRADLAATGGAVDSAAGSYARFDAAITNAKTSLGQLASVRVTPLVEDATSLLNALQGTGSAEAGAGALINTLTEFGAVAGPIKTVHDALALVIEKGAGLAGIELPDFSPLQASIDAWRDLLGIQSEAEGQAASTAAASDALVASISYQSPAMIEAAMAHQEAANAAAMHTAAILDDRQENIMAAEAAGMLSEATLRAAAQHLIAGQEAEVQAAKTELLRLQTQAAVDEFLRLNPTLSATQVAAIGAANGLSPLQIQLAQTTIRANEAQGALANFQRQAAATAGIGGLTPNRGLRERGPVGGRLGGGAGSSAAADRMRANAAISQYYPTVEVPKAPRARGGGGGAASKMADAQLKEYQQREDAERAHQQRLLDIQKEYAEKEAQQARKNEISKRKSRADFYDNLTSVTEEIGGEAASALSAEYEAAYAESQKIAQSGNKKLAADYLEMKEEQISAEAEYQQAVAQARKEGNDAEVARLEAIQAMRREANAEELKQLTEGGDAIVNERDAALAAEAEKYGEQTAKIETAAQRKEDAILRSSSNSADAVQTWADQVEDATRRATNALNSVPKVPNVTAPGSDVGEDGGDAAGSATGGNQGLAGANRRGFSGGGRAAGGGASGAVEVLSQANAILEQIVQLGNVHKKYIKPIELYRQTLGIATELLTTVADFHAAAAASVAAPIEASTIQRLVDEARLVLDLTATKLVPLNDRQILYFENYQKAVSGSIAILSDMADLRVAMSDALKNSQPFDLVAVNWLVKRAAEFTAIVQASLVPLTEKQADAMAHYADGVGATISIIGDLASLRQTVTEAMRDSSPFNAEQIQFLINRAKQFTEMLRKQLLPLSEQQASGLEQYAAGVGAAVSIIGGMADLRRQVSEAMANSQPFDAEQVAFLVGRAKQFTDMVLKQLLPLTQDQSDALSRYASGVGASAQIIADMAGLRKELSEPLPALDEAVILRLAQDSLRVLQTLERVVLPLTEEQAAAAQRYADTVGAAATALAAPFELSAQMFADYQSPSDAQLALLATDAQRIADWMVRAASTYDTKVLDAAKVYSETVGNTFAAFNTGLEFFDRLRYTDLAIDPKHLATMEQSTLQTLATMERLGARAAQIPPANIAALQNSAAALTAQMDALIRMTAVPWGNVPAAVAGYAANGGAAAGGGGGVVQPIIVNIYNPPIGMDVGMVQRQVEQGIRHNMTTRR